MFTYIRKLLRLHKWGYRNPYSRKCSRCGKRQDMYDYVTKAYTVRSKWCDMYSKVNNDCS